MGQNQNPLTVTAKAVSFSKSETAEAETIDLRPNKRKTRVERKT
jgi:hypothetical protein